MGVENELSTIHHHQEISTSGNIHQPRSSQSEQYSMTESRNIQRITKEQSCPYSITSSSTTNKNMFDFQGPTDEEMRRLTWKRDIRILPLVCSIYIFSFIDRANIGNAKLAGLIEDTKMSESEFNVALSIFFVGYILFQVPANILLNKLGPRVWIAVLLLSWGTVMASTAAVKNGTQLLVARLFLGIAEAGISPAIFSYISTWYTRQEQAKKLGIYISSVPCAGAVGGLFAYALMYMDGLGGMSGWQWIFIIEAIPTLFLAVTCITALPGYPEKTSFLTERERKILLNVMETDAGPASIEENGTPFSWKQFSTAFKDWLTYGYALTSFCAITNVYSISLFLPSIVHGLGFSAINAQAMTIPPNMLGGIFAIMNGYHAAKTGERGLHAISFLLVSIVGYALLITLKNVPGLYVSTILVAIGINAGYASIATWVINNFSGRTKQSIAIAFINSCGNLGGVVAGQLYRAPDAPRYVHGHAAAIGFSVAAILFTAVLKLIFIRINRKRDRMSVEERAAIIAGAKDSRLLLNKHPDFRYIP